MQAFAFVFGVLGDLAALVLFISPAWPFHRMWTNKSTQGFSSLPYTLSLMSCLLGLMYAILRDNNIPLLIANGTGLVADAVYLAIFIWLSTDPERIRVSILLLSGGVAVGFIGAYTFSLTDSHTARITIIGSFGAAANAATYLAPLPNVITAIASQNSEFVPFYPAIASFVYAILWTISSSIKINLFVLIPNIIGLVCGLFQIVVIFRFPVQGGNPPADNQVNQEIPLENLAPGEHDLETGGGHDDTLEE